MKLFIDDAMYMLNKDSLDKESTCDFSISNFIT